MENSNKSRPRYRPEIDGLRAIAIMPVVFYHAGFDWMKGGFIGVDIFFVISGYLIAQGILYDLSCNKFGLASFYSKRIRRIAPAFLFVLTVTTIIAWQCLLPNEMRQYTESLVGAVSIAANIFFYLTGGYFGAIGSMKPLLHTWSLSLEEQFYLCLPIIILALKDRISLLKFVLTILLISSFLYSEYAARTDKNLAYFLLPSRFWELGIGSCIAILGRRNLASSLHPTIASACTAVGIVIIAICSMALSGNSKFPGYMALWPCIAAALVIIFADSNRKTDYLAKILASRLLVHIGLVSYSLYLWHQPLFALFRHRSITTPSNLDYWLLIAVSAMLAIITRECIELRFLRPKKASPVQFNLAVVALAMVLLCFGWIGHITEGFPNRVPDDVRAFHITRNHEKYLISAGCSKHAEGFELLTCKKGEPSHEARMILIGDSHAQSIVFEMNEFAKAKGIAFYPLVKSGCATDFDFNKQPKGLVDSSCKDYQRAVLDLSIREEDLSTIIIFNRFDDPNFATGHPARRDNFSGHFAAVEQLLRLGKKVGVILPIPVYLTYISDYYSKNSWFHSGDYPDIVSVRSDFAKRMEYLLAEYISLKRFGNLVLIDPANVLCDSTYCLTKDNNNLLYFDDDHLSNSGAKRIVELLESELR